ncbi:hypothetical protein [Legionella longbeachae]|uniref:Uncharacterized protein n=1 Tax=Legionella longbeachae serogroup 1 (strain NSW150) TaxID=661367 RepID=D3HSP4_LEGLN|nr:hypothetical protein [Legionella longbeachae]VEE02428.1 Uncharacterised protein [Legionella oakridgensis]HBD7398082.1 hypothetical protein [Legionella pneumophila]ARB91293.1 hypothetical protein A6J40_03415 [Legionella longbeachae]ARM32283.1 hypothetical protein B0B39_01465 [Legionella longbeachae]EEZ94931.1 hypothetical protein LLB_0082 [Legionella longbeachae D-4968]
MRFPSTFIRLTFLIFLSSAEAKEPSIYSQYIGITHHLSKSDLSVYIDQNKILKNSSKLQKKGIIDRNLTNTEISFYDTQLAAIASIPYVTQVIKNLYDLNNKKDQIHIISYLLTTDLYGNKIKSFCYSFNFNRQLYQKINWKNFQSNNIVKIAPDFTVSEQCKALEETSPLSI